jgi:hypothetical protein
MEAGGIDGSEISPGGLSSASGDRIQAHDTALLLPGSFGKENCMPSSIQQKLQLKAGQAVAIINSPAGYLDKLRAELKENVLSTESMENAQSVILFVNNLAEVKALAPGVLKAAKEDCLLWIAYPKGTSKVKTDVHRDILWEELKGTGWRPVRLIAMDDTWSVMRFRPEEKVGK